MKFQRNQELCAKHGDKDQTAVSHKSQCHTAIASWCWGTCSTYSCGHWLLLFEGLCTGWAARAGFWGGGPWLQTLGWVLLCSMCFSSPTDLWSRFNKLAGSVLLSQWLLRCDHKIQVRSTEKKRMKFRHFVSSARKQTIFSTGLRLMIWPENYWGPQCEN